MKTLVQWTRAIPSGWETLDSADWADVPEKPDVSPSLEEVTTDDAGWVNRINVQGVIFTGDHYAVEDLPVEGGCKVTTWWDDPRTNPPGSKTATEITLLPLAPDPNLGGAINTKQFRVVYAEKKAMQKLLINGIPQNTVFKDWADFVIPDIKLIRHGKNMDLELLSKHNELQESTGWRMWTEHLDITEVNPNGALPSQRSKGRYSIPSGTMTMYSRMGYFAAGETPHTGVYTGIITLHADSITERDMGAEMPLSTGGVILCSTSMSGLPGVEWPVGNYRHQIDVTVAGGDVTYGLLNILDDSNVFYAGHFGRQNEANDNADAHPAHQQTESAFTGTGLKLATTGASTTWGVLVDDETDRLEIVITGNNAALHKAEDLTLQVNTTDDYIDGPWVEVLDHRAVITGVHTTSCDSTTRWDADDTEYIGRDSGGTLYRAACIFDIRAIHSDAVIDKILFEPYCVSVWSGRWWNRIGGCWSEPSGDPVARVFPDLATGREYKRYSSQQMILNVSPEYLNANAIDDLHNHIASGLTYWSVALTAEDEATTDRAFQINATAAANPSRDPRLFIYYARGAEAAAENAPHFGMNF